VINPPNGWVQNTNTWPYRSAGAFSAKAEQFPRYMDLFGENYRGVHAIGLLQGSKGWTLDGLQAAAFDSHQPAFARLISNLVAAWDAAPAGPDKTKLAAPIATLRAWNYRWSTESVAQSLAMFWASPLLEQARAGGGVTQMEAMDRIDRLPASKKLAALAEAVERLHRDFGSWQTPWGAINRFQRISPAIDHPFDDAKNSIPVGFASGNFGSLASFGSAPRDGSKRWYGTSGNSFVAVVEFGPRVRARAVSAGGESGDPASPHFNDQAARYASGNLRPVYFYPDELKGHIERTYHPGE
jgi:acyl-homoserine-lactone acylase